jgi:hypothetical protein
MRPSVPDVRITDSQDAELAGYQPLAGQAVAGLLFGLLSPLALVDLKLLAFPGLGVVLSWWALRRIKRADPALGGRKMALAGLAISLLFIAAAPADCMIYRWMLGNEAQQFSTLWFKYLAQDEPQNAHQLTVGPQARQPLDERLWAVYRAAPRMRQELEDYVKTPLVRTLLALGPKARVRFYQTAGYTVVTNNDQVDLVYAVTYEDENERKSFFVLVRAVRLKLRGGGADWRIMQTDGGYRPAGW